MYGGTHYLGWIRSHLRLQQPLADIGLKALNKTYLVILRLSGGGS
jgi:hypothetical protein